MMKMVFGTKVQFCLYMKFAVNNSILFITSFTKTVLTNLDLDETYGHKSIGHSDEGTIYTH